MRVFVQQVKPQDVSTSAAGGEMSLSAGANAYAAADGMLTFAKVLTLAASLDKGAKSRAEDDKAGRPVAVYVMPRRAKPAAYSVTSERKGDLKYRTQRAVKVVMRKRIKPESLARVKVLLNVYSKDVLTATQYAAQAAAVKALNAHMKKADASRAKVTKEKGKVRAEDNRVFEQSLRMVSQVLDKGGIAAANVATAQSMFGLQMFVKLDNDHVISIGKSDIAKFRAAKRGNADTAE